MVCNWKPNSSRDLKDHRMPDSVEGPSVLDHSDDSGNEDNINPVELGHYQLLPSDMNQNFQHEEYLSSMYNCGSGDDTDDSDESYSPRANYTIHFLQEQPIDEDTSDDRPPSGQIVPATQHRLEGWERTEISVDCDEIRSIMRGFSLPDSAVPEWASTVPESDFSSFVWDRIKPK